MSDQGWLRCERIENGMFSDEVAVVVSRRNGATESYFVPAATVEREASRVQVGIRNEGAIVWATLPTTQSDTIPVNKTQIAR